MKKKITPPFKYLSCLSFVEHKLRNIFYLGIKTILYIKKAIKKSINTYLFQS